MTVKVHGFADIGEFLTGNIDFFTITTLVPVLNTGVSIPLSQVKKDFGITDGSDISTKGGITIFGIFYADDDAYSDAFAKQNNLNEFIKLVETRAQTVMLNVIDEGAVGDVSAAIPAGGTSVDFGSVYAGNAGNLYSIKFATEHEEAWSQDTLQDELDVREILDLATPVISTPDVFDTTTGTLLNTIILKNQFI